MSDKNLTTATAGSPTRPVKRGPHVIVRHHSVSIPIYAGTTGGKTRYTIAFYRDGRRHRRMFTDLDEARQEAKRTAEKIQRGLQADNDLSSRDRELFRAVKSILDPIGTPAVSAAEEYAHARRMLGDTPLLHAVAEFVRLAGEVRIGVTVPEVYEELLAAKQQDGMSSSYLSQLRIILKHFADAFPGSILHVKSNEIDCWLRKTTKTPATRNNRLRVIRVLFSFARQHNYLPKSESTEASLVPSVKVRSKDGGIFTPAQFEKLLKAAPNELVPMLALGGFAGLRAAELCRLDWEGIEFDRGLIEVRASQAKTAARRIITISENLRAWLEPLVGEGYSTGSLSLRRQATKLSKDLGLGWPRNVLRHSFISYRVAQIGNVAKTALEAGNSPDVIFRHYREVVDEEAAKAWFAIMPPKG